MNNQFSFDVFLSHSSSDKEIVRGIAKRLKEDGLKVWFDEWILKPGDSIPANIEQGLEHSRVLVLCMSANAFGSEWATLESDTFRFRDPLNKERRFIPVRLDDVPIKGALAQFLYINWLSGSREQEYAKLLEACRPSTNAPLVKPAITGRQVTRNAIQLGYEESVSVWGIQFSGNGKRLLAGSFDNKVRLWNVETGRCLQVFEAHTDIVDCVALSNDNRRVLSGSRDKTVRLWDVETGRCLQIFEGHTHDVWSLVWGADQSYFLSGSNDKTIRRWDLETGRCLQVIEGHQDKVTEIALSPDQGYALSSSFDNTARLWDMETMRCICILQGHKRAVLSVAWSKDNRRVLTSSSDGTVRLWNAMTGRCLRVFEGETAAVITVRWSEDNHYALSGSDEGQVRLWSVETGQCLQTFDGHKGMVIAATWSSDGHSGITCDEYGGIRVWDLSEFISAVPSTLDHVQYTNAKVLLVGDSSAGKTGLSKRLALNAWEPSDSTVGAWATQWKLPVSSGNSVEREIWLWDFGGQADQRLIHQLYMDETALAVLVFDGQKEDLFETLGQWDRDLNRASQTPFAKLLVAGRVDAGGLRTSRSQIETFKNERGYADFLETSAKTGLGCEELKQAILHSICWDDIPWRSSPLLFKRLKEEIVMLKDAGRVLMRFNELREVLLLRISGEQMRFSDQELKAVLGLLAGPGVVWELQFGAWVLLQPERINAYAQAVIQTIQEDEHERGCLPEDRVLGGDLIFYRPEQRLPADEERFVLLAMHQLLVERGLCLREHTNKGTILIFPSYYRRERPELVGHPAALVSYCFSGFLDEIYATLVVRLHHTWPFQQNQLWRYAADFKTLTGKQLGVKLERRGEGAGELVVYADPSVGDADKIIFSRYIHEHILQTGQDMLRLRHYVCLHCGTPVGNRDVAMRRLNFWLTGCQEQQNLASKIRALSEKTEGPTIICANCEQRVSLWDEFEQHFASDEIRQRVHQLQEESDLKLDNESKDRALVGEVISTVALAAQISREFNVSDHGIDMEIEFKDDNHEATGKKLYLQLKSGDSHLRKRQRDGAEIFTIKDERHARYWINQLFPVFLVVADSKGVVRWMEIRDHLTQQCRGKKTPVKQIIFNGERFDVMSVRRWREKLLNTVSAVPAAQI